MLGSSTFEYSSKLRSVICVRASKPPSCCADHAMPASKAAVASKFPHTAIGDDNAGAPECKERSALPCTYAFSLQQTESVGKKVMFVFVEKRDEASNRRRKKWVSEKARARKREERDEARGKRRLE